MIRSKEIAACVAVYTDENTTIIEELIKHLGQQGYRLNRLDSNADYLDCLNDDPPDVIITTHAADCAKLFHLRDTSPVMRRHPLLVLLAEDVTASVPDNCADIILPPIPPLIDKQLCFALNLRSENISLQDEVNRMSRTVDELEQKLEEQERASNEVHVLKNAIVRNVSHELKTPLLHVKSAVALLGEDHKNSDPLIDYAKRATTRLETLVKNITLLGSSLDIHLSPVIIRDAVEYARRDLGRVWEHQDARERIVVHIEENLPPVLADKQGVSTVIQLLLDNALKFSQDIVEVCARNSGNGVEISVTDCGIGIAEKHIEAIFDTFYQVDYSSTRRYGGTGVGLAIARLILEHHNTHITVSSELEKGSTFSFTLPFARL
jgi:signal transduction histidine kinase